MSERLDVIEKNMVFIDSIETLYTMMSTNIFTIIYINIFTIIYKNAIIYLENETRCNKWQEHNQRTNDCEITLVISSQDNNVKNFSELQDLLRQCLKGTRELDQIEDDFDNQNIKTLQEAWKIIINDLAENIIEWIEEEFEGE